VQAAIASKETKTSSEDGFQQGVKDANRDLQGLNHHGFDDSCPKGHTAVFCDGYKRGYVKAFPVTTAKPKPTATPVPKQTSTSPEARQSQLVKEHGGFDDTKQDNTFDEGNGIITRDGTIIHNGKEIGHTKVTCGVNSQAPGCGPYSKATDLPNFKQPKSKAPLHSVGGGGNGTPNIQIVDNRQQQKVIVKVNTKVDTVTKNVIVNNLATASSQGKQPTFLLLLDTAQLCQLAGDTQCVAKQNQFKTLNLVTKLDSTGRTWTISGQTENIAARTKSQGNVQIVAYFYDSKGNNVGGFYKGVVNPGILKSLQSGAFNIKASTSAMKGTPSFFRLEYQTSSI
jgi:hypothetical protein